MISEIGLDELSKVLEFRYNLSKIYPEDFSDLYSIDGNSVYVKYTPISTVYNILESDSLYLFCSELSNDFSENTFFSVDQAVDTYISCFYQSSKVNQGKFDGNDIYSQWMSYCREGGVSFEFYFGQDIINLSKNFGDSEYNDKVKTIVKDNSELFDYSLIYGNPKGDFEFIKYSAYPIQVGYYNDSVYSIIGGERRLRDDFLTQINYVCNQIKGLNREDILPYFKHGGFCQEREARLVYLNKNNRLVRCINFLEKKDGTKVPYIMLKFGDMDANNRPCNFVTTTDESLLEKEIKEKIDAIDAIKFKSGISPIVIPQGYNQEQIYNLVEKAIKERKKRIKKDEKNMFYKGPSIICRGHLPITKITVAPTNDRREQRKKLEIYCKNKYWLRNVEICESRIPYNTNNINHI